MENCGSPVGGASWSSGTDSAHELSSSTEVCQLEGSPVCKYWAMDHAEGVPLGDRLACDEILTVSNVSTRMQGMIDAFGKVADQAHETALNRALSFYARIVLQSASTFAASSLNWRLLYKAALPVFQKITKRHLADYLLEVYTRDASGKGLLLLGATLLDPEATPEERTWLYQQMNKIHFNHSWRRQSSMLLWVDTDKENRAQELYIKLIAIAAEHVVRKAPPDDGLPGVQALSHFLGAAQLLLGSYSSKEGLIRAIHNLKRTRFFPKIPELLKCYLEHALSALDNERTSFQRYLSKHVLYSIHSQYAPYTDSLPDLFEFKPFPEKVPLYVQGWYTCKPVDRLPGVAKPRYYVGKDAIYLLSSGGSHIAAYGRRFGLPIWDYGCPDGARVDYATEVERGLMLTLREENSGHTKVIFLNTICGSDEGELEVPYEYHQQLLSVEAGPGAGRYWAKIQGCGEGIIYRLLNASGETMQEIEYVHPHRFLGFSAMGPTFLQQQSIGKVIINTVNTHPNPDAPEYCYVEIAGILPDKKEDHEKLECLKLVLGDQVFWVSLGADENWWLIFVDLSGKRKTVRWCIGRGELGYTDAMRLNPDGLSLSFIACNQLFYLRLVDWNILCLLSYPDREAYAYGYNWQGVPVPQYV